LIGDWSFTPDLPLSQLAGNLLPAAAGNFNTAYDITHCLNEIIAATTHIGTIRERATEICIALQDLELPAFVTLQILDEAVPENSIRMWAKWELITAIKHFQRERAVVPN
jgi:hypothetical protein